MMNQTLSALRFQEGDNALEGAVCGFAPGQLQGQGEWRVEGAEDYPLEARVFGDRSQRSATPLPAATPRMTDTGPVL